MIALLSTYIHVFTCCVSLIHTSIDTHTSQLLFYHPQHSQLVTQTNPLLPLQISDDVVDQISTASLEFDTWSLPRAYECTKGHRQTKRLTERIAQPSSKTRPKYLPHQKPISYNFTRYKHRIVLFHSLQYEILHGLIIIIGIYVLSFYT